MLTIAQAAILGLLQGVTELFPISSLGHTVIIPSLLHWNIDQHDPFFLSFIVATHFATALVLIGFFWRDWVRIVSKTLHSLVRPSLISTNAHARLGWLLVISTIPAGILGVLFQDQLAQLFASPKAAAAFTFCNGLLLFGAEIMRRRQSSKSSSHDDTRISRLSWTGAIKIGFLQCIALLPGFSRTGATLSGGLLEGFSHEDAARYAFLLATPIIFAAALLKLPSLLHNAGSDLSVILVGFVCSAIAAYLSVRFLSRYFKTNTLMPFALYCAAAGLIAFFLV